MLKSSRRGGNAPNYKMKKKKPCCDANCRQEEPVAKEGFIRITSICTWIVIIVAMVQCNYSTENLSLSYRTVGSLQASSEEAI